MQEFHKAAFAALKAAWNTTQVFEAGGVPQGPPTTPYDVVSASSGLAGNYRLSAQRGSTGYRIAVQAVGKTANEVTFAVDKADAAFLDKSLTVAGYDCSPCQSEVSSPIIRDPDGGVLLTCTLTYVFTAYPTT